jgi:hypothetical protein
LGETAAGSAAPALRFTISAASQRETIMARTRPILRDIGMAGAGRHAALI